MKKTVNTKEAPAAIGPYSQAVICNGLVYTSGQIPIEPSTGELVTGSVEEQTRRVIENLDAVLKAAGTGLGNVIKTTVFIKDMNEFAVINKIYSEYFKEPFPARSCIQAARLPKDVSVEIEAVAQIP